MKKIVLSLILFITSAMCSKASNTNFTTCYIDIGHQPAVIYQPADRSEKANIAIVVMHSHEDYLNFTANTELVKRGYTVIATLPGSVDIMENKLLKIKACIDYLHDRGDIRKIILLGHSGGATTMTAYQYLAENGREGLEGKLYQDYSDNIDHLPKADGILLLDANPGLSTVMLNSLDPNITDESAGNGVNPTYNESDEKAYMKAQQQRYSRLTAYATERLAKIKAGKGRYTDDEPMVIPGSNSIRPFNRLYSSDIRLLSHTKEKWPLIHADGSITKEIIHSVRAPFNPINATDKMSAAQNITVRSYLSCYAMTVDDDYEITEDGFKGIHFDSNLTSPIGNIQGIHVPSLFIGMTGSYEYISTESIFENSPAKDKSIAFVEGAGHNFFADKKAEAFNHANYGDTVKTLFDYVDKWISADNIF